MSSLAWLEGRLDHVGLRLMEWWAWPAGLVAMGAGALVLSAAFWPGAGETIAFLGLGGFPTCPSLEASGLPCGQCGMTRSWVWAVRGQWLRAVAYNPAGFALWGWLLAGGLVGGVRLARNDPRWGRWGWRALAGAGAAWMALYAAGWAVRSAGINPLP